MNSRLSNNNGGTNYTPSSYKTKAVDIEDPEFIENKRKIYGQYRPISSKRVETETNSTVKNFQSPRKAAVVRTVHMTENPTENVELSSCPSCGRKFNKGEFTFYNLDPGAIM
jgi:hypothetical protein